MKIMRTFKVVTIILLLLFTKNVFSQYETINLPIELYRSGGNITSFILNQHNPFIYSTTNGSSVFPFAELGNLVIQPRTSYPRDILFVTGDGDDIRMAIKGNGNIGIGTDNPLAKLEVSDDMIVQDYIYMYGANNTGVVRNTSNIGNMVFAGGNSTADGANICLGGSLENNDLRIRIGSSEKFRITSSGNIGIGTTDVTSKFKVIGQDIEFYSGTAENTFRFGRNINENFKFYVTDNSGFLDYNQDDDDNSSHVFFIRNLAGGEFAK